MACSDKLWPESVNMSVYAAWHESVLSLSQTIANGDCSIPARNFELTRAIILFPKPLSGENTISGAVLSVISMLSWRKETLIGWKSVAKHKQARKRQSCLEDCRTFTILEYFPASLASLGYPKFGDAWWTYVVQLTRLWGCSWFSCWLPVITHLPRARCSCCQYTIHYVRTKWKTLNTL